MKIEWKNCFRVCASLFLLFLCIHYWPNVGEFFLTLVGAATPLIIGCVIAYVINIIMIAYEKIYFPKAKKKFLVNTRRPICLILAFLSLVAIIVLIISLIVPELIECVQVIISTIPKAISTVLGVLEKWDILPEDILDYLSSIDWNSRIESIVSTLTSGVGSVFQIVVGAVSSVFSGIVTALIAVIFSIYLLLAKDKLKIQFVRLGKRYMKEKWLDKTLHILSVMNDSFRRYIVGQCTEAVILGLLCIVGMLALRLPYATMIGALVAFTALIPVAGAYIGAAVGAFMILTVSPMKALIFLIFIVVLQQLEGNIIYPRVVGSSLGLPGIWVLAAVTIGGGTLGIVGMLVGVPLASTLYRLLREDLNKTTDVSDTKPEKKQKKWGKSKPKKTVSSDAEKAKDAKSEKAPAPSSENAGEAPEKSEP